MNETLEQLIDRELTERYHRKIVDLGYWCGRCQIEAFPNPPPFKTEPIVGGDGWCPICGMNPRHEGPVFDTPKVGIIG